MPGSQATARLLDAIPGEVFTLGDHVYPSGTAELFSSCYHNTWGRHVGRTQPVPGNHDWGELHAIPYFDYFGAAAGPRTGYYSFNLGAWHILALNSNVPANTVSAQFGWVARIWRPTRRAARSPCGTTRDSAPGPTATRPRCSRSGGCSRATASIWC